MASAQPLDFAGLMPEVAPLLCGPPNEAMSKGARLRFGTHGSMEIDTDEGWFDDHEANARGGVLELIQHKQGCDKYGALTWLEEQGLKEWRQKAASTPTPTAFYDYADADGVVTYRVERRGKGFVPPFLQHGPDGRGGFHSARGCMQGVPRLPYRLPELLAAGHDAIVFVVEGEKDVDRLIAARRDIPLVATTNSGGAGKFGAELAPYFEGRRVVVIPDNDKPGRDHADDVAEKLRGIAAQVVILPLPGGDKSDVSDWLAMGGSAHQLVGKAIEALTAPSATLLPLLDPSAWQDVETPSREWYLDQWIPARQATYLTGVGSAGKSLLTQQLCTCIALGIPFMGVETRQAVAIYVTCEDDADELHRRQKAICAALGVRLADLSGKLHLVSLMGEIGNELIVFDERDHATPAPRFAETLATAKHVKAGFVALDNVAHLTADEIARNKVAAFVNMLNRLAREIDGSVLFLGHPNKAGDAFSGSTAWENQVRSRLFLETPKNDDGSVADPDARVLSKGKANYSRNGETIAFRWHQWAFVRDEDLPANVAADIGAVVRANAENDAFLKCLAKATEERRATSPTRSASNFAPRVFAKMTSGKGITERGFEAAMERLLHLGSIRGNERVYQRENRTWALGLACTNPCTNPAQSDAQSLHEPAQSSSTDLHTHVTLDTTYQNGAALGVAAPDSEEVDFPAPGPAHTPFPRAVPAANGAHVDLSEVVFPPTVDERADVLRRMMTPIRDEFEPEDDDR